MFALLLIGSIFCSIFYSIYLTRDLFLRAMLLAGYLRYAIFYLIIVDIRFFYLLIQTYDMKPENVGVVVDPMMVFIVVHHCRASRYIDRSLLSLLSLLSVGDCF